MGHNNRNGTGDWCTDDDHTACPLYPIPVEVISIIFTSEDVYSMADELGVDRDTALDAAMEWGKFIADTMTGYCSEQLESVIRTGQP